MMFSCSQYRDQMWEDLYGLLEADERRTLRTHVDGCVSCRQTLDEVRTQQQWLSNAAKLDIEIPLFHAPDHEAERARRGTLVFVLTQKRTWMTAAAAAVILLALGLPYGFYLHGLHTHELELSQAQSGVGMLIASERGLVPQFERDRADFIERVRNQHLQLRVDGPKSYRPQMINDFLIETANLDHQPVDVPVTLRLVDSKTREVLCEQPARSDHGKLHWRLPPDLPIGKRASARIDLVAGDLHEQLHGVLPLDHSSCFEQLTTDRAIYRPGETILFRSLTLDRVSLAPAKACKATFTLTGPGNTAVARLRGISEEDGIIAGQFTLPANCPEGDYTLAVDDAQEQFTTVKRKLHIQKSGQNGGSQTPAQRLDIDFFPEGGTIVAGSPIRIFCRTHTSRGQPLPIEGAIVDSNGQSVVQVHTDPQTAAEAPGLTSFELIPVAGQSYRFQATSAGRPAGSFPLPGVASTGLTLHVSKAILHKGEAVHLVLREVGPARPLVIRVERNGKLVSERQCTANPGITETDVPLPAGAGALRLIAYEIRSAEHLPVADRVVYQLPEKRLQLLVEADKSRYRSGDHATLRLKSTDENGKPITATAALDVVETAPEKLTPATASLPSETMFAWEAAQSSFIDQVPAWSGHDPNEGAALDLFLGCLGARQLMADDTRLAAAPEINGEWLHLDNEAQVRRDVEKQSSKELKLLADTNAERMRELRMEGEKSLEQLKTAEAGLLAYEARAGKKLSLWLDTLGGLAVAVGLAMLIGAIFRAGSNWWREPAWAGSIACASICSLAAFFVASTIVAPSPSGAVPGLTAAFYGTFDRILPSIAYSQRQPASPGIIASAKAVPPSDKPELPLVASREFVYHAGAKAPAESPATLYWNAGLPTSGGQATVSFDLPKRPGTYLVHIEGHTADGLVGVIETSLRCDD